MKREYSEAGPSKSIVVTGGCGFIGANLVRRLLVAGARVRVLDNLSRGCRANLAGLEVEVIEGDVRDPEMVGRALDGPPDAVVHLAAFGSVSESVAGASDNFEVNVRGTFNVLQQCVRRNVGQFVFASSGGAVLGAAALPVSETSPAQPMSPYGASKLCGEAYCQAFAHSFGLRTIALRFANVYGPHSEHKTGAVTSFIKALLADKPLGIYGDGSAGRDFLYVSDLCEGVCGALASGLAPGTVLHLATGKETTIEQLAGELRAIAGKPAHAVVYEPRRVGELERNFADFSRAKELLGFSPRVELRAGLALTWDWFQRRAAPAGA